MEWKTEKDIERVLGEIGGIVQKYKGEEISIDENKSDFELSLWNGVSDATPTVEVWIGDMFESTSDTIGQGVREIIAKMYKKMGCYPSHECPICHETHEGYDLSELPVEALEYVMQEIAEIAVAMNLGETEANVGRHCGPTICLEVNTMLGRVKLYFAKVQERFAVNGNTFLFFENAKGLCIVQAIEDVLVQARKHLETHKPHKCPVCGRMCP